MDRVLLLLPCVISLDAVELASVASFAQWCAWLFLEAASEYQERPRRLGNCQVAPLVLELNDQPDLDGRTNNCTTQCLGATREREYLSMIEPELHDQPRAAAVRRYLSLASHYSLPQQQASTAPTLTERISQYPSLLAAVSSFPCFWWATVYRRSSATMPTSISIPARAGDIPTQSVAFASCTVDPRYPSIRLPSYHRV